MTAALAIKSLGVSLGGRQVLNGVSLTIKPGEFVGLIGPNGAGKSTLLKSVFGLTRSGGEILLSGQDSRAMGAAGRARFASYLPQEREVHWPIKAYDLVALGRSFLGRSLDADSEQGRIAIENAMRRMDVLDLRDRRATDLSGGERARVLIARALAQEAPLLLADEPVAGLDPSHQISLMQRFSDLAEDGKAVLACLHEIPLASQWCSRLILLDTGLVQSDGSPQEVLSDAAMRDIYGIKAKRMTCGAREIIVPTGLSPQPGNGHNGPSAER